MDSESFFKGFWTAVKLGRHFVMGLISKFITRNGTYIAANDGADGYSTVTVDVTPEFTAADEGKVVENGALVAQTSRNIDANGTYDTTLNNSVVVNVSGGGGASTILSGAEDPTSSDGSNGDIYLKYFHVALENELPSGFSPLFYLATSSAGPYINTDVYASPTGYFEVDAQWEVRPAQDTWFFGAYIAYQDTIVGTYPNGNFRFLVGNSGFISSDSAYFNLDRHKYLANDSGLFVDNALVSASPNWSNVPRSRKYGLFAIDGISGNGRAANARIYSCKIWDSNTLVRNYVPAMRNNDNALGMYDVVNDVFYTNSGTGAFVAGPTIDGIIATYAKVNGVWQPLIGTNISDVTH